MKISIGVVLFLLALNVNAATIYASNPASGSGITSYDALTGAYLDNFGNAATALVYIPSSVPIPSSVWLFGSGLIGLVGLARRKG